MQKYDPVRLTGHLLWNNRDFLSNKKLNVLQPQIYLSADYNSHPTSQKTRRVSIKNKA
jgi:hypothetical protein